MLKQLSIKNFTLIAEATLSFESGFSAITGETGAGKSVLLKSLSTVCGMKMPASVIRSGEERAIVEAEFDVKNNEAIEKLLKKFDIEIDDTLVIRREISLSGKSRARANGTIISLQDLQELGDALIQMHGQSEQLMLRNIKTHTGLLDAYCGNEAILIEYEKKYNDWLEAKKAIEEKKAYAQKLETEKDFLKFQLDELEKVNLRNGEEEELKEMTESASKGEAERRFLNDIRLIAESENGLFDKMNAITSKTRALESKSEKYGELTENLHSAKETYETLLRELLEKTPHEEIDERTLDKVNARLAQIQRIKRKYKLDVPALIQLQDKRKRELDALENLDFDLENLSRAEARERASLEKIAKELSEKRIEGAKTLDLSVERELHALGMQGAQFKTEISPTDFSSNGKDNVEFLLAANLGEGTRQLQKAVSGGELSRVLLAFKTVIAHSDKIPLLIFDEVDSGISGEIGNKIGEALQRLGKKHQVLTITHLHQVAARAEHQIAVYKEEIDGRTFTRAHALSPSERTLEIIRMLGEKDSPSARTHAEELLLRAKTPL